MAIKQLTHDCSLLSLLLLKCTKPLAKSCNFDWADLFVSGRGWRRGSQDLLSDQERTDFGFPRQPPPDPGQLLPLRRHQVKIYAQTFNLQSSPWQQLKHSGWAHACRAKALEFVGLIPSGYWALFFSFLALRSVSLIRSHKKVQHYCFF